MNSHFTDSVLSKAQDPSIYSNSANLSIKIPTFSLKIDLSSLTDLNLSDKNILKGSSAYLERVKQIVKFIIRSNYIKEIEDTKCLVIKIIKDYQIEGIPIVIFDD